jgi:hypothetical protein
VLAAWLLFGSTCLGLGLLWYRVWRTPVASVDRLVMAFWVGLALAIGALQLAHFAVPIGAGAGISLLLVAGLSLAHERRALRLLIPEQGAARRAASCSSPVSRWRAWVPSSTTTRDSTCSAQ